MMMTYTLHTHARMRRLTLLACIFAALALSVTGRAQPLLTNGDFETGSFAGWTLVNQGNPDDPGSSGHIYISTPGAGTPLIDGIRFDTAANSGGGRFYAVSASNFPGAHAMLQDFTVPLGTDALNLAFQMFVNDQAGFGAIVDPSGLDYTTGGAFFDNQHARVDILRGGASDLSTASGDIVSNLYLGVDSLAPPNPYTDYQFDLTGLLAPGQTYRLRFAEVDNLSALNMGVDNVRITATAAPTPEPGSLALCVGLSLCGTALAIQRQRSLSL